MTPELRLIRYFVAVAEEGNVTRAARQLHIAQPSLSAALRQLEAQLGVELLRRDGRQLALTPAGELLRRRGRQLLAEADAVVAAVQGAAAGGRLRLGVSPTARYGLAPRLLALCAAESPGVMIYTQEDTTSSLVRGVADGHLDAAITFCVGAQPPSTVELVPLHQERAVVHSRRSTVGSMETASLAAVVDERVLVAASPDSSGYSDRVIAAFRAAGRAETLPIRIPISASRRCASVAAWPSTCGARIPSRWTAPRSSTSSRRSRSRSTSPCAETIRNPEQSGSSSVRRGTSRRRLLDAEEP